MRRRHLIQALCVAPLAIAEATGAAAIEGESEVVSGTLELPGVIGATVLSGGSLLLTTRASNGLHLLPNALDPLRSGRVRRDSLLPLGGGLAGQISLQGLTDAAWDGVNTAFVVTSHGRTATGEAPPEQYRLARLKFDATGKLLAAAETDALLQAVVADVPFLADAIRRTPARSGLNIEGLAWDPKGELLVGLRAPTVTESTPRPHDGQEDAVVLRLRNPDALFDAPRAPAVLGDTVKIDLRGQGIRGMTWDSQRKGAWVVAGLSAEPGHPVKSPWGLWFWNGIEPPRQAIIPATVTLDQPEAICRLEANEGVRLLLVEPGKSESRFVLLPLPA